MTEAQIYRSLRSKLSKLGQTDNPENIPESFGCLKIQMGPKTFTSKVLKGTWLRLFQIGC